MNEPGLLNPRDVQRRFARAAGSLDGADFVHRHTAEGLFERMEPMAIDVSTVVDLGCATGTAGRVLAKQFRRARVIGVDLAPAMLSRARKKRGRFSRQREVLADARQLPFSQGSIDIVFANLLLPWVHDLAGLLGGIARVLRKDGLFAFSTLGPDSLGELRHAWREIDAYHHVLPFADMHDIGDALVRSGLRDPVLDVDHLQIQYSSLDKLFADLTGAGARNSLAGRRPGLTGRGVFAAMRERLEAIMVDGTLSLSLELVYGHAWGGGPPQEPGEYRLDVDSIGRRRR